MPGSQYKGNGEKCPHGCGLTYGKLRTGLCYYDVFVMLMDYSEDSADWTYKRKATILGKWFQIKQQMWKYHIDEGGCDNDPRNVAVSNVILGEVPF